MSNEPEETIVINKKINRLMMQFDEVITQLRKLLQFEQEATALLKELAEARVIVDERTEKETCLYCNGEMLFKNAPGSFQHTPECLITRARDFLR